MSYTYIEDWCKDIADAIRAYEESSAPILHEDFPARISAFVKGYTVGGFLRKEYEKNPLVIDGACIVWDSAFFNSGILGVNGPLVSEVQEFGFAYNNMTFANLPQCQALGESAFEGCGYLAALTLKNGVSIGRAALKNTGLTTPSINCTSIGMMGFNGCHSLTSITLTGVSSIGDYAFWQCENLAEVILDVSSVPTLQTDVFLGTPIESNAGYIYVPDALVSSFRSATNWSALPIKPISER